MQQSQARAFPEIIALAFWARAANLQQIKSTITSDAFDSKQAAKVFHIAPANVDTVFFYSMLLSVLSGNQNIVRISQRSGDITRELIQLLQQFLQRKPSSLLHSLVSVVEYAAEQSDVTEALSHWSDLRVVWGGDNAIEAISGIAPQTPQLCFPDRYSIAMLHVQSAEQAKDAAQKLCSDILPFAQQACSSPKALYWWDTSLELQQQFYQQLALSLAEHKQQFDVSHQVGQVLILQRLLALGHINCSNIWQLAGLRVAEINNIEPDAFSSHNGYGVLLSVQLQDIKHLPFDDKLQTIATYGLSQDVQQTLSNMIDKHVARRHIELGSALVFNQIWDGVDLPQVFSQLHTTE
nr:acyl-CoA reductase [Neptunicella marina]